MRRRRLLAAVGGLLGAGLAGCLGGGSPGDPTEGSRSPTPGPSPTPTPGVRSTDFEVTDRGCGRGTNRASVSVDGGTVRVEGVIGGSNTCKTARLAAATLEDGRLTVRVRTATEGTTGTPVCGQCLVDIEYVATVTVGGDGPRAVEVVHESRGETLTVARVDR